MEGVHRAPVSSAARDCKSDAHVLDGMPEHLWRFFLASRYSSSEPGCPRTAFHQRR